MDVRYIMTTSTKLPELSVVSGQLIYLSDKNAAYYDMGGTRRLVSSMRVVSSLPSAQDAQEGVLYGIVNTSGHIDASIWDATDQQFRSLSGYMATVNSLGLVKPDGDTIVIDENGVISCHQPVDNLPASSITYDNTTSELTATDVQAAIDEVKSLSAEITTEITEVVDEAKAEAEQALTKAEEAAAEAATASEAAAIAQQNAANASTAAQEAQAAAQAASAQVTSFESRIATLEGQIAGIVSRLEALEATASATLIVEDGNLSS